MKRTPRHASDDGRHPGVTVRDAHVSPLEQMHQKMVRVWCQPSLRHGRPWEGVLEAVHRIP